MDSFFKRFNLTKQEYEKIRKVNKVYPLKITNHYANLIKEKGDPLWKQSIPDIEELNDLTNEEDPLFEENYTPVPLVVHRYPDRVLLLVSNKCAMYCRFCTRKRKVGKLLEITQAQIINAIQYIREHKEIRDVIVSGGDPLMLKDDEIEFILQNLRKIEHVELIRIGTRVPCTLPSRVTKKLCNMLSKYKPLFMNLHFEHPSEISPESKQACEMLADAGIPLGNQCVLLKGVNDNPEIIKSLFHKLLMMRVKPYYIYQADQVKGTEHFRTSVQVGLKIMEQLYGHTSGISIPQYVIDTVGCGKIPILPSFQQYINDNKIILRNFEGKIVEYENPNNKEKIQESTDESNFRIAVIFNLKRDAEVDKPEDWYAEFDDITIPNAIKSSLAKNGYQVELLEADENIFEKLKKGNYNFAFNIAEGMNGTSRESQIPAILDMLKIPYNGSGVLTQAITLDKRRKKELLLYHGINTPKFQLFKTTYQKLNPELQFPLIVKPNFEGSSKGIRNNSIVSNEEELRKMVKFVINNYKQAALVEELLEGREFTVSLIGNNPKVLPIVEVTFDYLPEHIQKIDSYEVKWFWDNPNNTTNPIVCPAKISKDLENKIKRVAVRTFKALECADFCRIDLRLDNRGIPNVLDVNALPGLIPDPKENSRFPKACYADGMTYDDIINTIFNEAMKRYGITRPSNNIKNNLSTTPDILRA
ncbi:MAG: KamA family radical SAM protein [Nanoarchaeota archaeon]